MRALLLLYFFFVSLLIIDESQAQTPGDPVPNASNLYFGTYSYRNLDGTISTTLHPGTYNGAPNGGQTSFNSSSYTDYYYKRSGDTYPINMRFIFPNGYSASPAEKYPLIVMLHGLGEGGIRMIDNPGTSKKPNFPAWPEDDPRFLNNDHQMVHGGDIHRKAVQGLDKWGREFPGFVVYPQHYETSETGIGWSNQTQINRTISAIEELLKAYPIDPNRIYIHGLSNGGKGVWEFVEERPDLFAAFLPMSAVINPSFYDLSKVVDIPLWYFQGLTDNQVSYGAARGIVENLEGMGGTPRYTEYNMGHNTWDSAYIEPEFFSWMLGHSKLSIQVANGRTHFCEGESFEVTLGITPGFAEYQWSKNETPLPNSNTDNIVVNTYGEYRVRFRRNTAWSSEWTDWSEPVEIGIQDPTPTPTITASGSTNLPSLDGAESVILSVPPNYAEYNWNNSGTTPSITVDQEGAYFISVTEEEGCPSDFSPYVYVVVEGDENIIAPTQLSANVVSESVINLFWNDNSSNEKGFEIYRATQSGGPYEFVIKTSENEISYADEGLDPDQTYYYKMRAVNNTGHSPYTNEASAKTDIDTENPSAPVGLEALANYNLTSITLTWKPANDNHEIGNYKVYQMNSSGDFVLIKTTSTLQHDVTGLTKDQSYTFMVKAVDKSGNESVQSNQVTQSTAFCGALYEFYYGNIYGQVSELGKPGELLDKGLINNFNLNALSQQNGVEKYFGFIFRSYIIITTQAEYTFYTRSDEGSKLFIDNQEVVNNDGRRSSPQEKSGNIVLSPGVYPIRVEYIEGSGSNYVLEVRYSNNAGLTKQFIPDDVLCSSSFTPPAVPAMPDNLTLNAVSETQINLSWSDSNPTKSGFEIYRSTNPGGPFEIVTTTGPAETTYEDVNLEQNTTYYYTLRTISNVGASEFYHFSAQTLNYKYYEGTWDELPDFSALSAKKTGTINNFDISVTDRNDNFGFVFGGILNIETSGFYTFYTSSDDGSKLYINDQEIVNNDGAHGNQERKGTKYLSAGFYNIRVEYFEKGGGQILEVRYEGPGIAKQLIPDAVVGIGIVSATTSADTESPEPPVIPWEITEKSKSDNSIGIEWEAATDNVAVTGYIIYNNEIPLAEVDSRGRTIDSDVNEVDDDSDNNTVNNTAETNSVTTMSLLSTEAEPSMVSTVIRGLNSGQTYNLSLRAYDAAGNFSDFSQVLPVTTLEAQPLPIELKDFYATVREGFVRVTWTTASETNNDYFTVERSLDRKTFKELGTVDGAGNSNSLLEYNFDDDLPVPGLIYYRIKQTDTNGVFDYSRIISVSYEEGAAEFSVNIYPNPVSTPEVFLKLSSSNQESMVDVRIVDLMGKVHLNKSFEAETLLNQLSINKSALSAGIYIFFVQQADKVVTKRVIIE